MGRLVYVTNMSVDGYIEDAEGDFDFGPPDDDVFASTIELLRGVGTFLYGRRLYEAMSVWETDPTLAAQSRLFADFSAAWSAADKVVYSTTLDATATAASRIERRFDPAAVRELKDRATRDLMVGGADLAAQAMSAGVVDECLLYVWPASVGGGKPALPLGARHDLELADVDRFPNGVVRLRYRVPV
ncbi:dihydrofolate reductase family protein [Luteimicrobium sp. DT211]|uniref:dihydrofolate reductase family protein n=1 Tax=Luteimicrobium sp. DT211 TaxID=3393412 RepID=UPI003CEB1D86